MDELSKHQLRQHLKTIESRPWWPQEGQQLEGFVSEADVLLYGGSAGGGKGLKPDTLIATRFGMCPIGELEVGQYILSADGSSTKITGIFPQRKQPVFEITFNDGATIICDAPHKWKYLAESSTWLVGSTVELIALLDKPGTRIYIPRCGYDEDQSERYILSIDPCEESETICIAVDHPSKLYVATENLIVTHNSDLLIGLALTEHLKTIIFRREATQLTGVIDRLTELVGSRDGFNSIEKIWRLPDRQIEFGSTPHAGDEQRYQGRPHDLIGFDELVHFNEHQFRFLTGWLRTTTRGQRCRIVCTSNPPTDSSGSWVIKFWAPWLDTNHPNPAESGELRWFVVSNGVDIEVDDGSPIEVKGEVLLPQSRTFIKSSVYDNAYLRDTGYLSTLMALPEPLRSQMLHGDFSAASFDSEWQVCPSADVKAAQDRWEPKTEEEKLGMSAVGVDPARGGRDKTVIACRHGWWYDELIEMDVVSGGDIAAKVLKVSGQSCPVHVDVVGIGASTYDHLEPYLAGAVTAIQSAGSPMDEYDLSGQLTFANRRSELWWKFRELLSSDQPASVALPKDPDLFIELTAPRYRLTARGIMIESKEVIKKRIGRSTDKADAVIYASIRSPHLFDFDAAKRFRIKQALG